MRGALFTSLIFMAVSGPAAAFDIFHWKLYEADTKGARDACEGEGPEAGKHCDFGGLESRAKLRGYDFSQDKLAYVSFHEGYLLRRGSGEEARPARFHGSDLFHANFTRATLRGVEFSPFNPGPSEQPTNLSRAIFNSAVLIRVDFTNANLQRASFHDASLTSVKFCGADLRGALHLTTQMIARQICNRQTILPNGTSGNPGTNCRTGC